MPRIYNQDIIQTNKLRGETSRFNSQDFSLAIDQLGNDVIWWKSLECPCQESHGQGAKSTCKNCGGSGRIHINPTEIRAIMTSLDTKFTYEEVGRVDLGMVQITAKSCYRLSHMDKIMVYNAISEHQEILYPKFDDDLGQYFAYCSYGIKQIIYMGLYEADDQPIKKLEEFTDYDRDNNVIYFNGALTNPRVTIRYTHHPMYYVWDIPHYSRTSKDAHGKNINLPIQAIATRAHLVLDAENINNTRLIDNSFAP